MVLLRINHIQDPKMGRFIHQLNGYAYAQI